MCSAITIRPLLKPATIETSLRQIAKLGDRTMPRKNEPLKVGISVFLPSATLDQIEETIEGKSRSEKIRNLIELGLQATYRNNKG
jgi:hypothetical protein